MKVKELAEKLNLKTLVEGDDDREVNDCYIGDLLSWVMGRMPHGSVWFTIMSNRNVLAVAVLAEAPAIVLCEGVVPDEDVLEKAREEELTKRNASPRPTATWRTATSWRRPSCPFPGR